MSHHGQAVWMVAGHSGWLLVVLAVAALLCFYFGFRAWGRARSVADTARARVRSAPHGYVELYGRAEFPPEENHRQAPLTGRTCVWWSYSISHNSGDKRGWQTVASETSEEPFVLRDETGACQVDPRGAEVTPSERQVWYGSESWPSAPYSEGGLLGGNYKYTEKRIYENDGVCVLGEFATVGGIADGSEEDSIAALLHEWKADQAGLLKRFDKDGDGKLSAEEWEAVRAAARTAVQTQTVQSPLLKQIAKPRDGRPFLVAAKDPEHLAQSYRWQAAVCLTGFFAVLMLLTGLFLHP